MPNRFLNKIYPLDIIIGIIVPHSFFIRFEKHLGSRFNIDLVKKKGFAVYFKNFKIKNS